MKARLNPFRVDRIHRKLTFTMPEDDWCALWDEVRNGCRGAIVGPKGYGKTTLCQRLKEALEREDRAVLHRRISSEDNPTQAAGELLQNLRHRSEEDITVILDGAEQLDRWQWWRFARATRQCHSLVITTHQNGRLPTLYTCTTSIQLLESLLDHLRPDAVEETGLDLNEVYSRCQGDLRRALEVFYDTYATMRD